MEHFSLRKYRGPETWVRVRAAYVAGESGPSVARRFDVGLANLRKKARKEGWARNHVAAAIDLAPLRGEADAPPAPRAPDVEPAIVWPQPVPENRPDPVDPDVACQSAILQAATLLAAGRAGEATAMLKAAEALARLTDGEVVGGEAEPRSQTDEERAAETERHKAFIEMIEADVQARANTLALDLLTDRGPAEATHGAFAWHWRERVLGPEVALSDFRAAVHGGWASRHWDAEGRLIPLDPCPPAPDMMMVRQHLRRCQGVDWGQEDSSRWIWPPRDWLPADQRPGADGSPEETTVPKPAPGPRVWRL